MDYGIEIKKLSKRYAGSKVFALKNLTLSVKRGEVYGFLGPNGAGKSTTIRLLMNFLQPTSGSASILGNDIVNDAVEVKKSIGYLAGDSAFFPKLSGKQYLDYMGELQPPASREYRKELTERMQAEPRKRMGDLSRGNKQKFGIIQAFMHKPDVIILDEPTSGLDPLMQEEFYKLVNEAKQRGAVIFMSSHVLTEVQRICDRAGIIRQGVLVDEVVIEEMLGKALKTFDITFAIKPPLAKLKALKGVEIEQVSGNSVTIHVHGSLSPLFGILAKHEVNNIDARNLDLEGLFMKFYESESR